jgi:guanylate kinase
MPLNKGSGTLFVISAPSGAGKTTLCNAVRKRFTDILYSISFTTRKLRAGEKQSVDYHFISEQDFKKAITDDKWAEWAKVHNNYYGTSREYFDTELKKKRDILLDIDVQGTMQILKKYPECISFFIMPPSIDTLRTRLEKRGTDDQDVIARRVLNAEKEIAQKHIYSHVIVNDRLPSAIETLTNLISRYRNQGIHKK